MITVLTTTEDTFLLLSSPKVKVQFLFNINVVDRYFVYETQKDKQRSTKHTH